MLRYVSDIRGYFTGKVGQKRELSFEVSNVGVVDFGQADGGEEVKNGVWSASRMLFSQSANVTGAPVTFGVCSVKGGETCLSAVWQTNVIERSFVEELLADFEEIIEQVVKQE